MLLLEFSSFMGMFWQRIISAFGSFRTWTSLSLREVSNFSSKCFNRRESIPWEDKYFV